MRGEARKAPRRLSSEPKGELAIRKAKMPENASGEAPGRPRAGTLKAA